uniref:Centriolar coiled-coil protein 110 n=1 Tax=Mastacembelus armatus TaxID=205130 RepID=A0A7N8Y2H9_9TELE
MGHHDHLAAGFRRRCHTLDSQLHSYHSGAEHIDRSQERVPRFMAGVTWLAPNRRPPPAPFNQSYEVENPSPSLMRPHVTPDLTQITLRMEPDDPQGPNSGRTSLSVLRDATEAQTGEILLIISFNALEDMKRRLEEEHALQMSRLLAEQEKEQQRLCLVIDLNLNFYVTCYFQVLTAEQQRAMCRIGAITRGFLTRRLLKTEKVKHLRQTVVDTQEFIRTFQTEAPQKKCTYSPQDLSLQERVKAQLRAALYDIHDIFFEMPLGDRLALLQQDRELRAERKLRDMVTCYCNRRLKRRNINPLNAVLFSFPRVLKPSQGQNSPVPAQLNRQG